MLKNKISVCLATYNEERNIGRCLNSVFGWAGEIIVVDGSSQDKTREIAKKMGARVILTTNKPMFHLNKQMGFNQAHNEWILYMDADEELSLQLKNEITEKFSQNQEKINGYWIPRKNYIFGKWIQHTGWWPDYQLRLFKKGKAKLACRSVHEHPALEGKANYLNNPLIHHHYENINEYLERLILYTENDKNIWIRDGKKISWKETLEEPLQEFIKRFVSMQGYLDGLHGLALSILQAFYQFIVCIKVWESHKFPEEKIVQLDKKAIKVIKQKVREYQWWQTELKINPPSGRQAWVIKNLFWRLKRIINQW